MPERDQEDATTWVQAGGSRSPDRHRADRREFITRAAAGTVISVLGGGLYMFRGPGVEVGDRPDGRPRVPPGQRVLKRLKDMGGEEGDPRPSNFKLKVYGEVEDPFTVSFKEMLQLPQVTVTSDVHCVTGWTVLDAEWRGVTLQALAERAQVKKSARHVIFEAAHGYTANIPFKEAMKDHVMIAHRLNGKRLRRANGTPVRAVVPDLYFWKSAKWLTGIHFSKRDRPGYWERRGYHNHGDPWKEERYS